MGIKVECERIRLSDESKAGELNIPVSFGPHIFDVNLHGAGYGLGGIYIIGRRDFDGRPDAVVAEGFLNKNETKTEEVFGEKFIFTGT